MVNQLEEFSNAFEGISPHTGTPPKGYMVDFLGLMVYTTKSLKKFNGGVLGGKAARGEPAVPLG